MKQRRISVGSSPRNIDPSKKVRFAFGQPLWVQGRGTDEHQAIIHSGHQARRVNVAGPRASQTPEIGPFVRAVLAAGLLR